MGKAEISWKGKNEEGVKREVYVHMVGAAWKFFVREKRYDNWEPLEHPLLEDYIELLDGVKRRIARRLLRPTGAPIRWCPDRAGRWRSPPAHRAGPDS